MLRPQAELSQRDAPPSVTAPPTLPEPADSCLVHVLPRVLPLIPCVLAALHPGAGGVTLQIREPLWPWEVRHQLGRRYLS